MWCTRCVMVGVLLLNIGFAQTEDTAGLQALFQSEHWAKAESDPGEVVEALKPVITQEGATSHVRLSEQMLYCKALFHQGAFMEAELQIPTAIHRALQIADSNALIPLFRLSARINKVRLHFDKALEDYQFILHAYQTQENRTGEAETYIDLAEFSRAIFQHEQGLAYIRKVKEIHAQHPIPTRMLARMYGREAALHCEGKKDYHQAEKVSLLALKQAEVIGDSDLIATCCNELGFIHLTLQDLSALPYFERAEKIWTDMGNYRYLANVRLNMARHFLAEKKGEAAVKKALLVLSESKIYGWESLEWSAQELLATAYAQAGDLDMLAKSIDETLKIAASLQEERHSKEFTEALALHKADLAEKELEIAHAEAERMRAQSRQQRIQLWSSLGGSALLLLLALIIYLAYRNKQHANALLEQKNREKDVLLKEIHHRVKNNLQIISSLLNLQSGTLKNGVALEAIKEGQNRVKSIALVHQKLYQSDDLTQINFEDYATQLIAFLRDAVAPEGKVISVNVDAPGVILDIDTAVPLGLIINELVTNAYKYAFTKQDLGAINVTVIGVGAEKKTDR